MSCKDISYEELDQYKDFDVTTSVLMAGADHLGQYCKDANDVYMLCRTDSNSDPRACLRQGQVVTNCTKKFFTDVFKSCKEPFLDHTTCVDNNRWEFYNCRKTQKAMDRCLLEKMGIAREFTFYQDSVRLDAHEDMPAQSFRKFRDFISDTKAIITEPIFNTKGTEDFYTE